MDREAEQGSAAARVAPDHRRFGLLKKRFQELRRRMPGRDRLVGGVEQGAMAAVAAIVAYLPTRAIGLREGFWAAITAIAVTQIKFEATRDTARDQFTGAAIGAVIGGVAATIGGGIAPGAPATLGGAYVALYCCAVLVAILACWISNVASAARLAAVTTTILVLVPRSGSVAHVMVARVGEVAWGVTTALGVVWLTDWAVRRWSAGRARTERVASPSPPG